MSQFSIPPPQMRFPRTYTAPNPSSGKGWVTHRSPPHFLIWINTLSLFMRVEVALSLFMRVDVALALFMRVEVALSIFMRVEVALALFMRVEVALALFMRVEVALGLFMRVVASLGLCMRVEVSRILVTDGRQSSTERAPTTTFLGLLGRLKQFPLARWSCLSRCLPLFPFVRCEVLPANSSPPHLIVFSTILCLFSSSSSLPPLMHSSHIS